MVKLLYVIMLKTSRSICLASFFVICFALTGCSDQPAEKEEKEKIVPEKELMATIVAVGDSLTAGYGVNESESYPALLEQKLRGAGYNYRVVNAGVSGETSSGTLARMEWILTINPDIVLLETGANDGLRGIEPELVEDNIGKILQLLKEREVVVVLSGMKMVWNMGPIYVEKFNSLYPRLAEKFNVIFQPFFLKGVATRPDLNLSDGLHPNRQGYVIVTENIYPYVLEAIKEK